MGDWSASIPLSSIFISLSAPMAGGVYRIWEGKDCIYVGKAADLKTRLLDHLRDEQNICLKIRLALQIDQARVDWMLIPREQDRVAFETDLIRRVQPSCNIQGK